MCWLTSGIAAAADEYESENQAQSVRETPVFDEPTTARPPRKISVKAVQALKPLDARQIRAFTDLEGRSAYVVGTVHSVYVAKSGSPVIFNLGPDHKTCFKVVVFRDGLRRWPGGSEVLQTQLEKKTILIDGEINFYQELPQIIVNLPHQLSVVVP